MERSSRERLYNKSSLNKKELKDKRLISLAQIIPPEIARVLPAIPGVASGTVEVQAKGWTRILYYDPVTRVPVKFQEPPTLVAIAEVREGYPPKISAPTITLPTVPEIPLTKITVPTITLPTAPRIDIPTIEIPATAITLPTAPTIEVPEPRIDYGPLNNLVGFEFVCGFAVAGLCDTLNKLMKLWDKAIYMLIEAVFTINSGFAKARKALLDLIDYVNNLRNNTEAAVNTGLRDVRNKTQTAIGAYRDYIQRSVNEGLADTQKKSQAALDTFRDNIQATLNLAFADQARKTHTALSQFRDNTQWSVNAGLNGIIPRLYEMIGLPMPMPTEEERKRLIEMGDVNGDYVIDVTDIELIKSAYGTQRGQLGYVESYDLNGDGIIDVKDIAIATANYGKSISPIAQLLSPVHPRTVTKESFEFYALGPMRLHYLAVGKKALI